MKRVILVHGWSGNPNNAWFPWLANELRMKGFRVETPTMPDPDHPVIEKWVSTLAQTVGALDQETFFVGHSIGCQTILRYLEGQTNRCAGAVLVAPWINLNNENDEESIAIAKPWIETPIDEVRVTYSCPLISSIFSSNDQYVPHSNIDLFQNKFNSKIILENEKGHFADEDKITTLPSALNAILLIEKEYHQ